MQRPSEKLAGIKKEWDALIAKMEAGKLESGERLKMDLLEDQEREAKADLFWEKIKQDQMAKSQVA